MIPFFDRLRLRSKKGPSWRGLGLSSISSCSRSVSLDAILYVFVASEVNFEKSEKKSCEKWEPDEQVFSLHFHPRPRKYRIVMHLLNQ